MKKNIIFLILILIVIAIIIISINESGKQSINQACIFSGGVVKTAMCCKSAGDFPNSCSIGACGCSLDNSHEVKICDCGEDKCFNGKECISFELPVKFSQTGNLVRNNPGLKKDTWYLLYEKAGAPALIIELVFNEESQCMPTPCSLISLENGERVKIEGLAKEKSVLVETLTLFD